MECFLNLFSHSQKFQIWEKKKFTPENTPLLSLSNFFLPLFIRLAEKIICFLRLIIGNILFFSRIYRSLSMVDVASAEYLKSLPEATTFGISLWKFWFQLAFLCRQIIIVDMYRHTNRVGISEQRNLQCNVNTLLDARNRRRRIYKPFMKIASFLRNACSLGPLFSFFISGKPTLMLINISLLCSSID